MSFPSSIRDREQAKFFATNDNETAVRVGNSATSPIYTTEVSGVSETGIAEYNEISSVASSVLTTITTYTIPVGKSFFLDKVEVSGSNLGVYQVEVNATVNNKKRTYWGNFNECFNYSNYPLGAGDIVRVRVIHSSSMLGDFNATILGILK